MATFILAHLGKQSDAEVPPAEPDENKINAYISYSEVYASNPENLRIR